MICKACNGKGTIQWEDEVETCPKCGGIGYDISGLADLLTADEIDEDEL